MVQQNSLADPAVASNQLLVECPLLRTKLARALFCTPAECPRALEEVVKFLILAADGTHPVTPSARVDAAWHEFILFTRTYISFCQNKLGSIVHHEPSLDHEANSQRYRATIELYRQRFGEPPAEYWGGTGVKSPLGDSAFCGSCEADSV